MYIYPKSFDVIVVGGGHAGAEAASAAARMGGSVLLVTHSIDTVGVMSCNPAIGGLGKTHLVKDIDALGGLMGLAADQAAIHKRVLNASKGSAVQAVRYQTCRDLYRRAIREMVESQEGLRLFQAEVSDLLTEKDQVIGIVTKHAVKIYAKAVVLTTGTFLSGKVHIGQSATEGGRSGGQNASLLATYLGKSFEMGRLKTGTPARLARSSLNFDCLEVQTSEQSAPRMSFLKDAITSHPQMDCYITHTNERAHEIIREYMYDSPIFQQRSELLGPRYCPSIEQKVDRFPENNAHQIFIEPEGLYSQEIYPNGISTSLPFKAQLAFIQTIKGFENAVITRPGYAVSYGFFDPRGLKASLETKNIRSLYFAGQINGTTGYEEAAAQGLMAGINAMLEVKGLKPLVLSRDTAYIGVLIDDLVTNGTIEPYRMFTSRAEYRLQLRCDNAHYRLTALGYKIGVVPEHRYQAMQKDLDVKESVMKKLSTKRVTGEVAFKDKLLSDWVKQPEVDLDALKSQVVIEPSEEKAYQEAMIDLRYAGYIDRQKIQIKKLQASHDLKIPVDFNYKEIKGLSSELIEKLEKVNPETVGQASRISGITPAALSLLAIHLRK